MWKQGRVCVCVCVSVLVCVCVCVLPLSVRVWAPLQLRYAIHWKLIKIAPQICKTLLNLLQASDQNSRPPPTHSLIKPLVFINLIAARCQIVSRGMSWIYSQTYQPSLNHLTTFVAEKSKKSPIYWNPHRGLSQVTSACFREPQLNSEWHCEDYGRFMSLWGSKHFTGHCHSSWWGKERLCSNL